MATVADRLRALSADDKALAKRIANARVAKAQLAELEPKIAGLVEESAEAQQRLDAAKAAMERVHKERKGLRNLFSSSQKKADQNTAMTEAALDRSAAFREVDTAHRKLAPLRQEKAALDKTVALLRTDTETRQRVTALLATVFDGPSPDYPEHERLAEAYKAAQAAYEEVQGRVSQAATVVNNVSRASGDLRGAINDIQYAVKMAEREEREAAEPKIIDWGYAAWMSNKSVEYAKRRIDTAEKVFAEAREIDPEVGDAFKPAADEAADGDWTRTPITSYLHRHGLKVEVLEECVKKLEQEVERGNSRTDVLAKERDPVLAKYNDVEEQLRNLREKILEEAYGVL